MDVYSQGSVGRPGQQGDCSGLESEGLASARDQEAALGRELGMAGMQRLLCGLLSEREQEVFRRTMGLDG
jgi:hypothetical protein